MVARSLVIYVFAMIIADVLLSIYGLGPSFPFIRFAIPLLFGYVFERDRSKDKPGPVGPILLLAFLLYLITYGPFSEHVSLFLKSDYFAYLAGEAPAALAYLFDISLFFLIGAALGKIAEAMRASKDR